MSLDCQQVLYALWLVTAMVIMGLTSTGTTQASRIDYSNLTMKIAVVLPQEIGVPEMRGIPFTLERVLPAVSLAIEKSRKHLPPGVHLHLNYTDSRCSDLYGPLAHAYMHLEKSADVFLGPSYMYGLSQAARYSHYFKVPTIAVTGLTYNFYKRVNMETLTTMTGNYIKLSWMFRAMFRHYGFNNMGLLLNPENRGYLKCDREVNHEQCQEIIRPLFRDFMSMAAVSNLTRVPKYEYINASSTSADYEKYLRKRETDSRSK